MRLLLAALAVLLAAAAPAPERLKAPFASLHAAAVLHLGKTADWVLATGDAVWVGSTGPFAAHRIDPHTDREAALVELPANLVRVWRQASEACEFPSAASPIPWRGWT
ncbi:MAG TPA: hypothetical protein VGH03_01280 [Caulobacteraceae bacterium]